MNQLQFKDGSRVEISEFKYANAYLQICLYSPIETVKELFYNANNLGTLEFYIDDKFAGTYSGYLNVRNITLDNRLNADLEPVDYCTVVLYQPLIKDRINTLESTLVQETSALNTKTSTIETKVIELDAAINPVVDTESMTLKELKQYRINESKQLLAEYLSNNPLNSDCHNQTMGTYSITKEKQDLMISNYITYQIKKQTEPNTELTWNETGKSCELWTEAEFLELICQVEQKVKPRVSKQQALEEEIMDCKTKEEVSAVVIDYVNV
ncbi:hypothetical protein GKG47_21045 [Lactonifactor sp. BIOML-A3]|uniref:hypothetical protein n=1 Tax=unclassified Lactonifactor TaxID=2636670 RepID=UPI0012B0479F|nr:MULTISPECIES: hypothetical protein [unclassified Lactonifactor]MSA03960.1 hypothetical protein [Lactonifactor sp. BIOML-A5]MSA10435.1 hypothetical protein [Lactonifactor sp. BIOML-A4]MSA14893.1 hypothetical protein [Lactonifactor sp. BIOML-A3]MSA19437.1 hypothetical protein [Lactonifactor sp. BIOML-A2]MSA40017.1 hypothetical protein [Lactonifactor sp. BIOML-A1]